MALGEDNPLLSLPNFEAALDSNFNQPGLGWVIDTSIPNQSWKGPPCDSENIDPTRGNSHFDFNSALQAEQPQICFDVSMDDAIMPLGLVWPPGAGVDLSTATSGGPEMPRSAAGREGGTTQSHKIHPNHLAKKRAMLRRKALVPRPFLNPTPDTASTTSKKVNSIQKRRAKIKGISPMKLISHLEDEFQSNPTVSRDFKLKSSEIIGSLKNLIDYERHHGSSAARIFLSPEEEDDNDLSSTGSPDIVSPSFSVPSHTPNFNSRFQIYPDTSDCASKSAPCAQTYNLPSRHKYTKPVFHCTYPKCKTHFKTATDWKRHETEVHWLQKRYMCLECDITVANPDNTLSCIFCSMPLSPFDDAKIHSLECQDAKDNGRTFARKDKLRKHIREEHGIHNISAHMESWTFDVECNWPDECGFCGIKFSNWDERASHIEDHYKQGFTIEDWKVPFYSELDSVRQHSGVYPENGGDDDDGGPGGNQNQSSLQPYGYNLGGWPGNSSSHANMIGQGNSSTSTGEGQQHYRLQYGGSYAHQHLQSMWPVANFNREACMAETDKTTLPTKRRLDLLRWQSCLLSGIARLCKRKVNHGGMLPTNILTKHGEILPSSFSLALFYISNLAKRTHSGIKDKEFSFPSMCCAPEVASRTTNELPSDLFSMGCVLEVMLAMVYHLLMKGMEDGLMNGADLKAYRRNLKPVAKWIGCLSTEPQNTTTVWGSTLGPENCQQDAMALRRCLRVISAMFSASPSKRSAAMVLIQLLDTKSFFSSESVVRKSVAVT